MHYLDEGDGRPGAAPARRADVVVPLPQDDPAARAGRARASRPTTSASAAPTSRRIPAGTRTTATSIRSRGSSRARPARITLVVQDWGGPVGFRLAVEQPERVARLVVMNTGIGARAPGEEWLRFQSFMRRVGTEIVAGQLVRLSLVQPVSDEVIAGYDAPFPVPESRIGIVQFPELVATSADHPSGAAMLACATPARARPAGARPLLRQRPDLLPPRGRGDGRAPARRRARPAGRGRGPFPAGRPRRAARRADRRVAHTGFYVRRHPSST